jgi:hypothetical protein
MLHRDATFVAWPDGPASFCLDVVERLRGYKLVWEKYNGVQRFAVRTPKGKTLTPHWRDRGILCCVDGKTQYFNAMNLLASVLLGRDVTDNEYAILVVKAVCGSSQSRTGSVFETSGRI